MSNGLHAETGLSPRKDLTAFDHFAHDVPRRFFNAGSLNSRAHRTFAIYTTFAGRE